MQCYEFELVREYVRQLVIERNPGAIVDLLDVADLLSDQRLSTWLDVTATSSKDLDAMLTMLAGAWPTAA